jgi:hypothetical protein
MKMESQPGEDRPDSTKYAEVPFFLEVIGRDFIRLSFAQNNAHMLSLQ